MQIWSASGFSQVVHWIIPYGWLWNSILPDLVSLVNHVQSQAISEASYYRLTSRFVNDVLDGYTDSTGKSFDNVKVTGVSLGGGLAIITGAQTDAFTVAFSGMGAILARDSLDPPVLLEKINNQVSVSLDRLSNFPGWLLIICFAQIMKCNDVLPQTFNYM